MKRTPKDGAPTIGAAAVAIKLAARKLDEEADTIARDRVRLHQCRGAMAAYLRGECDREDLARRFEEIFQLTSSEGREVA